MKQRVLAILAAACLIALAVVARNALAGDDGPVAGKGGKGSGGDGGAPTVACTPDLMAICKALADDDTIAKDPPKLDLNEAAQAPSEIDGWITWAPTPDVVNFEATEPRWGKSVPLLSAEIGASVTKKGASRLGPADCNLGADWQCVAELARGGEVTLGVGDVSTAEGLARVAPLTGAFVDGADADAPALRLLTRYARVGRTADQVKEQAVRPPGADVVIGQRDVLETTTSSTRGRQVGLQLVEIRDAAVFVVLSPTPGVNLSRVAEEVRAAEFGDVRGDLQLISSAKDPRTVDPGSLYQVWKAVR